MTLTLKPIKPKLVADQVFEQLRELIFRGKLKPGERLMPERQLAEALGVSRPTLRAAIQKLVAMGLLDQKQGQGTFVKSQEFQPDNPLARFLNAGDVSLKDLLEVRIGLECNAADMAARRASEEDIRILGKSLSEMKEETSMGQLGTEADVSFHMAISFAGKNPVQIHMMRSFYDFLFMGIKENLIHLYETPDNIKSIVRQHTDIFNAIRRHDPDAALNAMKKHIVFVMNFFKDHNQTI